MKITLYTVSNCQFSKQERDYLTAHNISFEEKNLEVNRDFLGEMLALSNNFAGTPVTKIEKGDGQIAVLKGFTQAEFDQALGLAASGPQVPTSQPETPKIDVPPVEKQPEVPQPEIPIPPAPTPLPPEPPIQQNQPINPQITEVQQNAAAADIQPPQIQNAPPAESVSQPTPQITAPQPGNLPNMPDFNA